MYFASLPVIATLVGGFVTALFGFLAARSDTPRTPKFIAIGALVGGLLVLLGGLFSGFQSAKEAELLQSRTQEISDLSKTNAALNARIAGLATENAQLSREIANSMTGGDSFCYFLHSFPVNTDNTIMRMLIHVGRYPLHDLRIRIVDGNKLREISSVSENEIEKTQTRIYKPTFFKPGQGDGFPHDYVNLPPDKDYQSYSIFFTAVNGEWHQQVSFRRVEGKWKLATKVTNYSEGLLMPEQVRGDFPRDTNGNVKW